MKTSAHLFPDTKAQTQLGIYRLLVFLCRSPFAATQTHTHTHKNSKVSVHSQSALKHSYAEFSVPRHEQGVPIAACQPWLQSSPLMWRWAIKIELDLQKQNPQLLPTDLCRNHPLNMSQIWVLVIWCDWVILGMIMWIFPLCITSV